MAYMVYLGLAFFILTSFVVPIGSYPKQYISVVSDVHEFYKTSDIFFVVSRNNRRLEDYTSAHSLSRVFSRNYDFASIVYFDQLDKGTKWYDKRIGRSLLVVFLRSLSEIDEFASNVKFTSEPYVWLVIFTNESGSSALCEYCNFPKKNDFRLRFDTEMLVLCCNSLVLKKWSSIDGYHTEVSDVAGRNHENKDKLIFLDPALSAARRYDAKGVGIRIGLVENSVFAQEVGGKFRGFFGDILNELKRSMNFTITEIVRSPAYGGFDSTTRNWSGLIGRVIQGEVDLGVTEFAISEERCRVVDFTLRLLTSQYRLYIRDQRTSEDVHWTAYFQVFSVNFWIVMIVLIIVVPPLLAVMKVFRSSRSLPSLIVERYLDVWGIFCQQGLREFPARPSLRVAYFSILILALTVYAAYSASLVSIFAISLSGLPFTTLEEFVDDGSYRLIALRNSAPYVFLSKSTNPVLKKMMKLMNPAAELPENMPAAWKQVCRENVAAYLADLSQVTPRLTESCQFTSIESGYTVDLAMIMPAGSQYSKAINYHLQRFKDTGVVDRIKHQYLNTKYPSSTAAEFNNIYLRHVIPVLVILIAGLILALVVLSIEAMYNAVKTYLHNRRRRNNSWTRALGSAQLPFVN